MLMMLFAHLGVSGLQRVNKHIDIKSIEQPNSVIHRGSYMSAHFSLNLLSELGKVIKCEACQAFYHFFATS